MNRKPLNELLIDCAYLFAAGFFLGVGFCSAALVFWFLAGALA